MLVIKGFAKKKSKTTHIKKCLGGFQETAKVKKGTNFCVFEGRHDIQQNDTCIEGSFVTLSITTLSFRCHFAESCYAECRVSFNKCRIC